MNMLINRVVPVRLVRQGMPTAIGLRKAFESLMHFWADQLAVAVESAPIGQAA